MIKKYWKELAISIVAAQLVGAVGSLLGGNMGGVYRMLEKPPVAPPGWLFGLVWPVLYLLIALAAFLVYRDTGVEEGRTALRPYVVQLCLNPVWNLVFFRFHMWWTALLVLLALLVLAGATACRFKAVNPKAWWLFLPYLLWLVYALYLNFGVALLN